MVESLENRRSINSLSGFSSSSSLLQTSLVSYQKSLGVDLCYVLTLSPKIETQLRHVCLCVSSKSNAQVLHVFWHYSSRKSTPTPLSLSISSPVLRHDFLVYTKTPQQTDDVLRPRCSIKRSVAKNIGKRLRECVMSYSASKKEHEPSRWPMFV
jgi:hypothetical protein